MKDAVRRSTSLLAWCYKSVQVYALVPAHSEARSSVYSARRPIL